MELYDFFDPTPEQQSAVLVNTATLHEAERLIESCEHCNPSGAEIPFDNILDRVNGSDLSVTDYILESHYDRRRGRLEIEFTWTDDVRQFYAIAPAVYRRLLAKSSQGTRRGPFVTVFSWADSR
jgi:hypothetical protein